MRLINLGFVLVNDTYICHELDVRVKIKDDKLVVTLFDGRQFSATVQELEDAIVSGALGVF